MLGLGWLLGRLPHKKEVEVWSRDGDFSPDVWALDMQEFHPLFEYGESMLKQPMHNLLGDLARYHGIGFTEQQNYAMWTHRLAKVPFPIAMEDKRRVGLSNLPVVGLGRIRGELHMVRPAALYELDKRRLNGIQFVRRKIIVDVPHRKQLKIPTGDVTFRKTITGQLHEKMEAFAYIGVSEYWKEHLDAGYNFPISKYIHPDGVKSKPFYEFEGNPS